MQVRPLISRALRLLWIGIIFEMCSIEGSLFLFAPGEKIRFRCARIAARPTMRSGAACLFVSSPLKSVRAHLDHQKDCRQRCYQWRGAIQNFSEKVSHELRGAEPRGDVR